MTPTFPTLSPVALRAVGPVALRAVLVAALAASATEAGAAGMRVKMACANDYYTHCSAHPIDSQELRQCMRQHGPQLSKTCLQALISAGEVSQAEVDRRRQSIARAASAN